MIIFLFSMPPPPQENVRSPPVLYILNFKKRVSNSKEQSEKLLEVVWNLFRRVCEKDVIFPWRLYLVCLELWTFRY